MSPTPKDEEKEHFIKATEATEATEDDDKDEDEDAVNKASPCKPAVDEHNVVTSSLEDLKAHSRISTSSDDSCTCMSTCSNGSSKGSTYKETDTLMLSSDAVIHCRSVDVLPQATECVGLSQSVNDIVITGDTNCNITSKSMNNVAVTGDTTSSVTSKSMNNVVGTGETAGNITSRSMTSVSVTGAANSVVVAAHDGSPNSCRCDRLIAQHVHTQQPQQQQQQQHQHQEQQQQQQQQQQQLQHKQQQLQHQQQQLLEEREPLVCPHSHEFRGCPVPTPHPPYGAQYPHYDNNGNNGFVAVTLQHLNGHILPVRNETNDAVFMAMQQQQQQHQNRAYGLAYETSQSSDSVICRICHSSGEEKLIAPCKCAGSSRYVHEPCLVTWFKKSVKNECELCRSEVKIKKINHSLTRWRKPEDRPIPLIWFSVFFIGLFLNILSIHVNASEYCKSTACLIFYIVNGFGIILDSAFLYFWFLKCRHYCKKWFALNQDWFIDDLDTPADVTAVEYVRSDGHNPV